MHWLHSCLRPLSALRRRRVLNEVRQILGERSIELENQGRREDAVKVRRLQSARTLGDYRLFIGYGLKPHELVPSEGNRELHIAMEEVCRHKVIARYLRRDFMRYLANAKKRGSKEL